MLGGKEKAATPVPAMGRAFQEETSWSAGCLKEG